MWPTLHSILGVLNFWDFAFIGSGICLVGIRCLKKSWPIAARIDGWIVAATKTEPNRRPSRLIPAAIVLVVCIVLATAYFNQAKPVPMEEPIYPREVHQRVAVIKLLAPNLWQMYTSDIGWFRYRACGDFDPRPFIQAGYIADHAIWEVHEHEGCNSIRGSGLGFFWEHDDKGNVIEIKEKDYANRAER